MDRRGFLKGLMGLVAGLAIGKKAEAVIENPPDWIDMPGKVTSLKSVGDKLIVGVDPAVPDSAFGASEISQIVELQRAENRRVNVLFDYKDAPTDFEKEMLKGVMIPVGDDTGNGYPTSFTTTGNGHTSGYVATALYGSNWAAMTGRAAYKHKKTGEIIAHEQIRDRRVFFNGTPVMFDDEMPEDFDWKHYKEPVVINWKRSPANHSHVMEMIHKKSAAAAVKHHDLLMKAMWSDGTGAVEIPRAGSRPSLIPRKRTP